MFESSVANATPRNIESVRSQDLIPSGLRDNAKNFVSFIEHYYDYMNSVGLPSAEIGSIVTLKDIDEVSDKYLTQIEELIGKLVPNSQVLNKVEFYKLIVKYYNTRGSEDSIHTFFKLFLDKVVEVIYPKDYLFDLSMGDWNKDSQSYNDFKSQASNVYKIFDGVYWQNYSYVIKTDVDPSYWYEDFTKLVHPSGLGLFTAIVIEMFAPNVWNNPISYTRINEDDLTWLSALVPPHLLNAESVSYNLPKYQPGFLRDQYFAYVFKYLFDTQQQNQDYIRQAFIFSILFTSIGKFRDEFVREQYVSEKFIDPLEIGAGMLDKVIGDAIEPYSRSNKCKFLNLSTFVRIFNSIIQSYYDDDLGPLDPNWGVAFFSDELGPPYVGWEESWYEPL